MAFKFNVKPMTTEPMDRIDLLQAQEEMNQAFMDLTDAQKNMTEVCEVMENIQTSVDLITKYGATGVEQLNVDGSLEALLQVPAKLITAEKAQEGLGEAAKAAWEKFKEWVSKIVKAVVAFCKAFANKIMLFFNKGDAASRKLSSVNEEKLVSALKEKKVSSSTEGLVSEYFKDIRPGSVFSYDEFNTLSNHFGRCFGEISEKAKEYFDEATPLLRKLVENPADDATKSALDDLRERAIDSVSHNGTYTSLKDALTKVTEMNQKKGTVSLYELGYTSKDKLLKALQFCTGMRRIYDKLNSAISGFANDMTEDTELAIKSVITKVHPDDAKFEFKNETRELHVRLRDATTTYLTVSRDAADLFSTCIRLVNSTRDMIIGVIDNVADSVETV